MLKAALFLGIGFSLGYAKALNDSGGIKEVIETFKNDEELKAAFKDLGEALKRVKENEAEKVVDEIKDDVTPEPDKP
jgi:hypothetical protein